MIHIAIISHGHEDLLIESQLGGLLGETKLLKIWVKDNKPSSKFRDFCQNHGIFYTDAAPGLGFGHNNNFLFDLVKQWPGFGIAGSQDIFLVMNPDITVQAETVYALVKQMQDSGHTIATLSLFRDAEMTMQDANIRHFPGALSILKMPLTNSFSEPYNSEEIASQTTGVEVEWASGAFLAFTAAHYQKIGGFDPSYFMYFEDVDICYRSRKYYQQAVHYYPHLKAIHIAAHKNRNIASRHANWFFQSFFKFLVRRYLPFYSTYPKTFNSNKRQS